ncbi:MAG TPA: hypothetical protein VGX23_31580 [Actinocrinis sp.]|nr:hypothetical protein [Actinocrinis sp.]
MRVYLSATFAALADLARTGELGPAPLSGYAVTEALREAFDETDDEELEYFATTLAAEDSFRLVTEPSAAGPARRVVVVADLSDGQVAADLDPPGAVRLAGPVPRSAIASYHVDEPDFAADPKDPEAAADQELLWYAAQELGDLLEPRSAHS